MKLFVSLVGNDENEGTIKKPLRTIKKAKEILKEKNDDESVVFLRGGRYFFNKTLKFDNTDCKNVTYKCFENEKVFFDGGIVINNSDVKKTYDIKILERIIEENAREHIFEIDLKPYNIKYSEYGNRGFRRAYIPSPNELYIDNIPQRVASYPNDKYMPLINVVEKGSKPMDCDFSLKGAVIGYNIERANLWANSKDAYISGFFGSCFADDTIKIDTIDIKNKTISTTLPHLYGFEAGEECRWKILNLLEELSVEGEYYIDKEIEKIYFYPKSDMVNSFIQLSVLDTPFFSFLNACDIKFEGITFENSRGMGVYIEKGENVCLENCIFRNLGMIAVQIGKGTKPFVEGKHNAHGIYDEGLERGIPASEMVGNWHEYLYEMAAWDGEGGKNHKIFGCEIYNMGTGGIILGGGNRKKLIPANNMVYNTHIHNVNRLEISSKGAVNIWGVGNIVKNCELNDLEGNAVYLHGNDHVIEYNKIHNALKSISDAGVIYLGRDPSEVGNIIRHNFIYNIKNPHSYDNFGFAAIYFDDGAIYNEVYGNYFYDIVQRGPFYFSTIHWNGGGETSVSNNIFIDCFPGPDLNFP